MKAKKRKRWRKNNSIYDIEQMNECCIVMVFADIG